MNQLFLRGIAYLILVSSLISCTLFSGKDKLSSNDPLLQGRGLAAGSGSILDGSGYSFDPRDKSCGGYPRLKVQTLAGTCLGLVISQNNNLDEAGKLKLKMPRLIVKVPGTEHFLVTDMGGWSPKIGRLAWLKHDASSGYSVVKVMEGLDLPHGLAFNERDQYFYLGENSRIIRFRFNPSNGKILDQQVVIDNLADTAKHMHPLTHFVFNPKTGDLYMNSGAPTDHCYQADGQYKQRCPDETVQKMATIQRIPAAKLTLVSAQHKLTINDVEVAAQGLRNSMAMTVSPQGRFLIQGENSRDFPELEEPYEEMNVIRLDQAGVKHYGWPYCYNNHATSPEWEDILIKDKTEYLLTNSSTLKTTHGNNPFYCGRERIPGLRDYQRPYSLIPPHAAPLAAEYYEGEMFHDLWGGQLLMSWHGHRTTGQRFIAYKVNEEGLPVLTKPESETYGFNLPNGCTSQQDFNPRGGLRSHFAKYQEIISGWGPVKGMRPKGSPVGFTVANDGSIWIVEDKNKTIVRLARSPEANFQQSCDDKAPSENKDFNIPLLVWRNALLGNDSASQQLRTQYTEISNKLRTPQRCLKCHESFINKDLGETPDEMTTMDFFVRSGWLVPGNPEKSLLYGAIKGNGIAPQMPPAGFEALDKSDDGVKLMDTIRSWISNLPQDIDSRWQQISVGKTRNIRPAPTTNSKPCGQFQADDTVYVDPRSSQAIQADGNTWIKAYLLPGHTRLSPGACKQPLDGVYWIAK